MKGLRNEFVADVPEFGFRIAYSFLDGHAFLSEFTKFIQELLRARKSGHYSRKSKLIADRFSILLKKNEYKPRSGMLKGIVSDVAKLKDSKAVSVEEYWNSVSKRLSDSLARYLSEKLGVSCGPRWNPDDYTDPGVKLFAFIQSMSRDRYLEDFQMRIPGSVRNDSIKGLIMRYYTGRGFRLSPLNLPYMGMSFVARKRKDLLMVCVTRSLPNHVQVTVQCIEP